MRRLLCAAALVLAACSDSAGPSGPFGFGLPAYTSEALPGDSMLFTLTIVVRSGNDPVPGVYWASSATRGTVSPAIARTSSSGTVVVLWRAPKAEPGDYFELRGCVANRRGVCTDERPALISVTGQSAALLVVDLHQQDDVGKAGENGH